MSEPFKRQLGELPWAPEREELTGQLVYDYLLSTQNGNQAVKRNERCDELAFHLNWLRQTDWACRTVLPRDRARKAHLAAALRIILDECPCDREALEAELAFIRRGIEDGYNWGDGLLEAEDKLSKFDRLLEAARDADLAGLSSPGILDSIQAIGPFDNLHRQTQRKDLRRWQAIAVKVEEFMREFKLDDAGTYRFIAAVMPHITGESPKPGSIKEYLLSGRKKGR